MQTFTASRMSEGNKIYQSKIMLDERSLTVMVPGMFSGKETTILFNHISSVDIECPLIGYSTITIETTGEDKIVVHGFTQAEVREIKKTILEKM